MAMHGGREPLPLLHIVGSAYLTISLASNNIVQRSGPVSLFYAAAATVGFVAAYTLILRDRDLLTWFLSFSAAVGGLAATIPIFLLAPNLVDPSWAIFIPTIYVFYRDRKTFGRRRLNRKITALVIVLLFAATSAGAASSYLFSLLGGGTEWAGPAIYSIMVAAGSLLIRRAE